MEAGCSVTSAKQYGTILADPPWNVPSQRGSLGAVRHYPLMTIEQIGALRVNHLTADDAHLWQWVTNAAWREQVTVMDAWGFSYRSCLTWIKPRLGLGATCAIRPSICCSACAGRRRSASAGRARGFTPRCRRTATSPRSNTP